MKKRFSKNWKSSRLPRKQRKYLAKAPIHIKKKITSSGLSKDLRKKYGKRSLPLRKNDVVRIMTGKFKGKEGKIINVDTKTFGVYVEGIQRKKQDGSKVNIKIHPSNLQITQLNLEDSRRSKFLKKQETKSNEKQKPKAGELENAS